MAHPRQCKLNILKLRPKPAGGYRTIGILPTLLRMWCRIRPEFIRCWQITNARDYFWCDAGRGSEKAVWWESLANESCVLKGRQAVTVLLDLFKCFERVLHVIAFKNALKSQFPPLLLRWVFLSYRHLRLLQWQGAVSETAVKLVCDLAAQSGLDVSWDKFLVVASHVKLAKRFAQFLD